MWSALISPAFSSPRELFSVFSFPRMIFSSFIEKHTASQQSSSFSTPYGLKAVENLAFPTVRAMLRWMLCGFFIAAITASGPGRFRLYHWRGLAPMDATTIENRFSPSMRANSPRSTKPSLRPLSCMMSRGGRSSPALPCGYSTSSGISVPRWLK